MYTFKSEKELENIIRIDKSIPDKVIENAKYHIGLVEDSYEDGACGNFYILTDDNGIDSVSYKDCLANCNLDEDEYEFDDLICIDNSSEWHVRAYIGTEAYWVCEFRYACYDCRPDRISDSLYAKPYYCTYDVSKGEWIDKYKFIDKFFKEI